LPVVLKKVRILIVCKSFFNAAGETKDKQDGMIVFFRGPNIPGVAVSFSSIKKIRLWCAVSGHGFGHFSQVSPIINQLARQHSGLEIYIAAALPKQLLSTYIDIPFIHDDRPRDVCLVQPDPLSVDLAATRRAMRQLHNNWEENLALEREAMAAFRPDLLLADIPYLPIMVADSLDIPSVAVASLSWDHVIHAYYSMEEAEPKQWYQAMREAYAKTTVALLPEPAIIQDTFPVFKTIPPLSIPAQARKELLRRELALSQNDNRPIALVSLGGIPANSIPIAALAEDERFHWLLDIPIPTNLQHKTHLHLSTKILNWNFRDLSASVDGIVSKPGYGMAVASAMDGVPFLYVRRKIFPDEEPVGRWLDRHGRGAELDKQKFDSGDWADPLLRLMEKPLPAKPDFGGIAVAVEEINRFLGTGNK
jgi:hypothetical protein